MTLFCISMHFIALHKYFSKTQIIASHRQKVESEEILDVLARKESPPNEFEFHNFTHGSLPVVPRDPEGWNCKPEEPAKL